MHDEKLPFQRSNFDELIAQQEAEGWTYAGPETLTHPKLSPEVKFEEVQFQSEEDIAKKYRQKFGSQDPTEVIEVQLVLNEHTSKLDDLRKILSETEFAAALENLSPADTEYFVFVRKVSNSVLTSTDQTESIGGISPERSPRIAKLMEHEAIKEFIEDREIKEEDVPLIERALQLPLVVWSLNHNNIKLHQERMEKILLNKIPQLQKSISEKNDRYASLEQLHNELEYSQIVLEFIQKYDWTVAEAMQMYVRRALIWEKEQQGIKK